MPNYLDRAKMTTATTGTGTVTLGTAVSPLQTFAAALAVNAAVYSYLIEDGSAWEVGRGVYTAAGTTLSRVLVASSTGALLNLSGAATVSCIAAAHDLRFMGAKVKKSADQTTADYTTATALAFNAEDTDTDAFHDTVTNNSRLTIPAGLGINQVELTGNVRGELNTADTWMIAFIRLNGTTTMSAQYSEFGNTGIRINTGTGQIPVVAGDYFELMFQVESDASVTITAIGTFLSLKVVG